MTPGNPVELALLLIGRLEGENLDYAVGGALALGFRGIPRGTLDLDITALVAPGAHVRLLQVLHDAGCSFDADVAAADLAGRGTFRAAHSGIRIDVFVPDIEFYESAQARRRRVALAGRPIWIWSAEDLVIFKLLYFRLKDQVDIEAVLRVQGERLDRGYSAYG